MTTKNNSTQTQSNIFSFLAIIGLGVIPTIIFISSCYMVNDAFGTVAIIALVLFFLCLYIALSFTGLIGFGLFIFPIIIKPLKVTFVIHPYIISLGFLQTLLWVLYPENHNFEPRATFILAIAAFIAFLKPQIKSEEAVAA